MSSRNPMDGASGWCSGGPGFDSCRCHVRYISILTWLRGFQDQTFILLVVFFVSKSHLGMRDKRNFQNLKLWPESLGAMLEYWYIGRGLFTFHETLVYRSVCHLRIHLLCLMLAKQPICQLTQVSFKSRLIIFTIWHLTIRFPVWLLKSQSARNKGIHQVSVVDLRCWPAALHYCLAPESNFFRRTCNSEKSLSVMFFAAGNF